MAKLIVAFADKQLARKVTGGLEAAGLDVFRVCATGNEVLRAFNICEDGVLVCGAAFPDRTADSLAYDLAGRAIMLAIGRPEQLALCESPDIYTLPAPFSMSELTASVNILLQAHYKRLPRRTGDEKALVEKAKEKLMRDKNITESEAHSLMQRYCMKNGVKMTNAAKNILGKM